MRETLIMELKAQTLINPATTVRRLIEESVNVIPRSIAEMYLLATLVI